MKIIFELLMDEDQITDKTAEYLSQSLVGWINQGIHHHLAAYIKPDFEISSRIEK